MCAACIPSSNACTQDFDMLLLLHDFINSCKRFAKSHSIAWRHGITIQCDIIAKLVKTTSRSQQSSQNCCVIWSGHSDSLSVYACRWYAWKYHISWRTCWLAPILKVLVALSLVRTAIYLKLKHRAYDDDNDGSVRWLSDGPAATRFRNYHNLYDWLQTKGTIAAPVPINSEPYYSVELLHVKHVPKTSISTYTEVTMSGLARWVYPLF